MGEECEQDRGSADHQHRPGHHHFQHIRHVAVVLVAVVADSSIVNVLITVAANAVVVAIVVAEAVAEAIGDASVDEKKAGRGGRVDGHHHGGHDQPTVPALLPTDGQHPGEKEERKGPDAFAE